MSRVICLRGARLPLVRTQTRNWINTPLVAKPKRPTYQRCYASGDDKSWAEIGTEAKDLAKDLFKKFGATVTKAVDAIVPSKEEEERRRPPSRTEQQRREDIYPPAPSFGGGIVGNLLGKAVGKMINKLGDEIREAQERVADIQSRVTGIVESSTKLQERLGQVRCLPPVSQSSQVTNINGRMRRSITLILPVMSSRGQATAEAVYLDGDRSDELSITVRLPNGEVINLNNNSGGGAFRTIDVEWKSVD